MKKLLIALLMTPALVLGQDLATYSISTSIAGMTIEGQPPGVGDRSLSFDLYIDPTDLDAANEVFYSHLEVLLGPDQVEELRAVARSMTRGGRR